MGGADTGHETDSTNARSLEVAYPLAQSSRTRTLRPQCPGLSRNLWRLEIATPLGVEYYRLLE